MFTTGDFCIQFLEQTAGTLVTWFWVAAICENFYVFENARFVLDEYKDPIIQQTRLDTKRNQLCHLRGVSISCPGPGNS